MIPAFHGSRTPLLLAPPPPHPVRRRICLRPLLDAEGVRDVVAHQRHDEIAIRHPHVDLEPRVAQAVRVVRYPRRVHLAIEHAEAVAPKHLSEAFEGDSSRRPHNEVDIDDPTLPVASVLMDPRAGSDNRHQLQRPRLVLRAERPGTRMLPFSPRAPAAGRPAHAPVRNIASAAAAPCPAGVPMAPLTPTPTPETTSRRREG